MKKLLIILTFLPLISWGQNVLWRYQNGVVVFQGGAATFDTTISDTLVINNIGDGVEIGDGIKIGDGAYLLDIELPKQYMKEEETLNELIS